MKHSFSTKKRNKLVEDLRHWNEDLRRSLERPEVPAEDDSRKVGELKRRFNIQRSNSIRQSLSSLHRTLESGFRCTCSPPHQAAIDLDWASFELDTAKPIKMAVSYTTISQKRQLPDLWRKLHVNLCAPCDIVGSPPQLLSPSPLPVRDRSPASRRSKMVHLFRSESRTPPPPSLISPNLASESSAVSTSASTEITNLCKAVCTECNPWTLAGFLKDPEEEQGRQFSFDHSKTEFSEIIKAVPLKSLISSQEQFNQQQNTFTSLSAKQRFGIAASVAWSVLHLSGSPWLGNQWDDKQASIFLEKSQGDREILSRHPCALYIFSPPTTPEEPPTNNFKHLIPNIIVFSLGILLIELCINKSFTEIRHTDGNSISDSLLDDYQTALSKLDEVYRLAGDSYGDAVARCVKSEFQGRDIYKNFEFAQFRQQFYDAVVAPVQATYLMFPDSRIAI